MDSTRHGVRSPAESRIAPLLGHHGNMIAAGVPATKTHSGKIYILHSIGFICSVRNQDLDCPRSHTIYRLAWSCPDFFQVAKIRFQKITLRNLYVKVYGRTLSIICEACLWDAV
jgi:hypothetical protein